VRVPRKRGGLRAAGSVKRCRECAVDQAAKECTAVGETTKAIAQTEKACQVPLVHLLRGLRKSEREMQHCLDQTEAEYNNEPTRDSPNKQADA
jgi:hypothetical protein